jgi:hypothetical protein
VDTVEHAPGENITVIFSRWLRWLASHLRFSIPLYFATNLTWNYLLTCRRLDRGDLRVVLVQCLSGLLFVGLFLAFGSRVKDKSTPSKVGWFLAAGALLFACNKVLGPWLMTACAP